MCSRPSRHQALVNPAEVDRERTDPQVRRRHRETMAPAQSQEPVLELAAGSIRFERGIDCETQELGLADGAS
jgi:hypothetical protein